MKLLMTPVGLSDAPVDILAWEDIMMHFLPDNNTVNIRYCNDGKLERYGGAHWVLPISDSTRPHSNRCG